MPGQGQQPTGSSNTNAWNRPVNNQTSPSNSYSTTGSAQQPINLGGNQHSPLSSSSTDASASTPVPTAPRAAPTTQRGNPGSQGTSHTPQAPRQHANPGAHWFGVYKDDSNDEDEDENDDQPEMDTTNTTAQDSTGATPTMVPPRNPIPQASAEELI